MKYFDHPNVLSLIGVSFDKENNPAMVLPFMSNGDVKAYLLSQRVSDTDVDTFPPVMFTVYKSNLYLLHIVQFATLYKCSIQGYPESYSYIYIYNQYTCILSFRISHMRCYTRCAVILLKEWSTYANYTLSIVILQEETACKLNS